MKITNTFCSKNDAGKKEKQSEVHRRCILLLHTARNKESLFLPSSNGYIKFILLTNRCKTGTIRLYWKIYKREI